MRKQFLCNIYIMSSDTDSSDENYEKPSLFPKFHKTGAKDAARRRTAIRRKKLFSRMYAEQAKLARESIGIEDQLKARWREMEQEDAEEKLKQQVEELRIEIDQAKQERQVAEKAQKTQKTREDNS